jgi:hypothetical protein
VCSGPAQKIKEYCAFTHPRGHLFPYIIEVIERMGGTMPSVKLLGVGDVSYSTIRARFAFAVKP